jgi:hypothetical protein
MEGQPRAGVVLRFMSLEMLSAIGSVGALFVLGTAACAAIIQLRHMRTNNQLQAILSIGNDFHAERMQDAFAFVQTRLEPAMADPAYRAELAKRGFIDSRKHPEMEVCNWFDQAGMLVKGGFVDEDVFFEAYAKLVDYCWGMLSPTVAVLRRQRGPTQYESFEYLAVRARLWRARHPDGTYPRRTARAVIDDPWLAHDETLAHAPAAESAAAAPPSEPVAR